MPNAIQRIYPNANASAANLGRTPMTLVQRASLVGEFLFGRDAATSVINSAQPGSVPGAITGNPAFGDHFAVVDNANHIVTNLLETAAITAMVIYAPGADVSGDVLLGTAVNSTGAGGGFNLFTKQSTAGADAGKVNLGSMTAAGSGVGLTLLGSVPVAPLAEYRAVAGRFDALANPNMKVDEFKAGARIAGASLAGSATRILSASPLKVGSLLNSVLPGPFNACALLVWNAALSDADLLAAYIDARAYLAPMGKAI